MGKIVAAMATVHAPQLFTRPPSEDLRQLDADIAAMRELGKDLDATKPDAVIVIGADHMETFFLSSVPTFALIAGEKSHVAFAGRAQLRCNLRRKLQLLGLCDEACRHERQHHDSSQTIHTRPPLHTRVE